LADVIVAVGTCSVVESPWGDVLVPLTQSHLDTVFTRWLTGIPQVAVEVVGFKVIKGCVPLHVHWWRSGLESRLDTVKLDTNPSWLARTVFKGGNEHGFSL